MGITDFVIGRNMFLNFFNPIWWIKRFYNDTEEEKSEMEDFLTNMPIDEKRYFNLNDDHYH